MRPNPGAMSPQWLRVACWAILVGVFAIDLATPQLFVVAILLNVPIALSTLVSQRRLTQALIVAALLANAIAAYVDGAADGYRWDPVAVGDRVISALSFLLVGLLAIATQRAAQRAGELAARELRAGRHRLVRAAIEDIRSSSNAELIARAVVREGPGALGGDAAWLYLNDAATGSVTTFAARLGDDDVRVSNERPEGAILSLLERVDAERATIVVGPDDALGRLWLDRFAAARALVAPIEDRATLYGTFVLTRTQGDFDPYVDDELPSFVQQSAIALGQAMLFETLAERNAQLARANVALVERGDVIRDIVYALSHDLRTPLSAAAMTMRQAIDGAYGALPPPYLEILRRTSAANDELQRLAETLLLVSRYESGDRSRHREPVALGRAARLVLEELTPLWREKGLHVTLEERAAGVTVEADPGELRRAIVNLVANAVTFTPPARAIELFVDKRERFGILAVSDSGHGVPEAERAQLFSRVRTGSARPGAGSGLGLYLVRRIAENHGGKIAYEPRAGGGSVFRLFLPLAAAGAT